VGQGDATNESDTGTTRDGDKGDGSGPSDSSTVTDGSQTDSGDDSSGPWSPVCPQNQPPLGTSCPQMGLYCEYNEAWWNVNCSSVVYCGTTWGVGAPGGSPCLPEPGPNPASCPVNPSFIHGGTPCPEAGLTCYYEQGITCDCFSLSEAGSPGWSCLPEATCPSSRPRLGSPCNVTGPCTYEYCAYVEGCVNGMWQPMQISCQ
jgi:hypothetical protein